MLTFQKIVILSEGTIFYNHIFINDLIKAMKVILCVELFSPELDTKEMENAVH